jgi:DNA-binding NarL/FixJ family response regulator
VTCEPVRVLIVDDHPAVRAGLQAALEGHPGFVALGAVAGERELWPGFHAASPDLVLLDYHLPESDGFSVCRRLKAQVPAPHVVVYSAYADSKLTVPALLAGADGLVHKGAAAPELFAALARAAAGERTLPPLRPGDVREALAVVDPADEPLLEAVLRGDGERDPETAAAVDRALALLRLDAPAAVPSV